MLNYAGKDYLTACKNHVVLNISARVGKAFKLFFDALPQNFRAEDRNKARRYFMRRMTREGDPEEEEPMWASFKRVPTAETRAAVVDYVDHKLERYEDLPLDVGGLHPTTRVEKRWWHYLRWLYDLQLSSQEHDTRAFSILPLCTFVSKHVTIDTGILHGLLTRVARRTGRAPPEPLPDFRVDGRAHWESHFKLTRAEGRNTRRDFECMLKTDGYAVSVILSKAKVVAAEGPPPDISLCGKRVVGVDPGRVDLASCAWRGNSSSRDAVDAGFNLSGQLVVETERPEGHLDGAILDDLSPLESLPHVGSGPCLTRSFSLCIVVASIFSMCTVHSQDEYEYSESCSSNDSPAKSTIARVTSMSRLG